MKHFLVSLCLLGMFIHALAQCSASEFRLEGDYLLGGLFGIHHDSDPDSHDRPEAVDCASKPLISSSYRRFQLMRFAVDEINNSTNLLPNVSLGYEIFDQCSDTHNFPGLFYFISANGLVQPWGEPHENLSKVMAVVGPYTSTKALAVAPLLMMNQIPMISYGAASSAFSRKQKFPYFLRTVQPNKDVIELIVAILLHFDWHWVAFLYISDDYGNNGLELFMKKIKDTQICLAYIKGLNQYTNHSQIFKQINAHRIGAIIVFAPEWTAEALIESAINQNVTNKVWIASDAWSLNKNLPRNTRIRNIGTVIGVSEKRVTIPGFSDFIHFSRRRTYCENASQNIHCNQVCNCSSLSAEDVVAADPSFNFPVYSAVYAIAHALHNALQCGSGRCNDNITVFPHMLLAELKKSDFTLLNQSIRFDENGDPDFGSYSVVFWNHTGHAEEIGFYHFDRSAKLFINNSQIKWHKDGEVPPTSVCSKECLVGFVKKYTGTHQCCFDCEICPGGSYVTHNTTEDAYRCINCKETEWSAARSTSCNLRSVEYIPFTDTGAILIMLGAWALVGFTLAVSVLFAINYNTPVVRSAGGPMCFLILVCLGLCSISVFFYFGEPTTSSCILRFLPFLLFYTVCLACFVVRSFQIVFIFKIAANFPKLHSWWMKYHGQWLVITVAFGIQALLLLIGYTCSHPDTFKETVWYPDKIILGCDLNLKATSGPVLFLLSLCSLCFIFSYMGKDLPKNYNEAKAITFCLLLLILTWIIFATTYMLYHGKYIPILNALAILSSLYSFLVWYFLPKCYIMIFQSYKNTHEYFQGLIQNYTKTISQ
ncbi:taste receptor type 1 member 1-like [Trematomus bernacchii]|uniref:taste receptor type 1 member 1-like n=1 Tax=Trematomus bernacchii TaxID=40690 RepID=UPI00146F4187|nr:taste receptor type 1 member 1-like [Trematomus bernacchii]